MLDKSTRIFVAGHHGLVGSAIVAGAAVLVCMAGGFFRKKKADAKCNR